MKVIAILLSAAVMAVFLSSEANAYDSADVTIVDTSESVKDYVKALADRGVTVIGRFYSRCPQWNASRSKRIVMQKRMIDNPGEVKAILDEPRLNILSVYQFYSQGEKFDRNRTSRTVTVLDDRPRNPEAKTVADFNDCITPPAPNDIEVDAQLDGYAAVTQAKEIVKQPPGTAIYFGVDFDLTPDRRANVVKYFQIIHQMLSDAGYEVGVYGNGAISDLLFDKGLAKYVWLTASPAHSGSANTYNMKHWDLLQTKTDLKWKLKSTVIGVDTNMQNPKSSNVGFWNESGSFTVPQERNDAVYASRRFVCEGSPVVLNEKGSVISRPMCTQTFGTLVRTFEKDAQRTLVRVDCDEDGYSDGWMKVKDLAAQRPIWIDAKKDRKRVHCLVR